MENLQDNKGDSIMQVETQNQRRRRPTFTPEDMQRQAREAFRLHSEDGLTYIEIADIMGISPGTAKFRVHEGRALCSEAVPTQQPELAAMADMIAQIVRQQADQAAKIEKFISSETRKLKAPALVSKVGSGDDGDREAAIDRENRKVRADRAEGRFDERLISELSLGRTHLVIPDSHAHPDYDSDRFDWLGKFILDIRPDLVVDIGDQADMPSLSIYDGSRAVGGGGAKKAFEGRRYLHDIAAANDARVRIMKPLRDENARLTKIGGRKLVEPELVWTVGNHEERILRVPSHIPELEGVVSLDDLNAIDEGWQRIDFLKPYIADEVCYRHYHPSGVKNAATGGENAAASLVKKHFMSCVSGHSHLYDGPYIKTRPDGKRLIGLFVGVYDDHHHDYAGPANSLWWRGLVLLRHVRDGGFSAQQIPMDWLRNTYGGVHR